MRTSEEIVDIMRKLGARDMISLHQNEPTYFLSGGGLTIGIKVLPSKSHPR
jgi:hypothetical protein